MRGRKVSESTGTGEQDQRSQHGEQNHEGPLLVAMEASHYRTDVQSKGERQQLDGDEENTGEGVVVGIPMSAWTDRFPKPESSPNESLLKKRDYEADKQIAVNHRHRPAHHET